ncbi:hypothetical protein TPAU25S_00116 [Tsukamurella paurometabola]|nr:Daunorubicin/doxorubicin resistance ABC transporter permease protein drrB [Tsukamurella paurometabola]
MTATVETHQTSIWQQSWIMVKRSMIHTKRMPEMLSDVTIQPIMFTVLFAFVFGAAIPTQGVSYREYLLPGILGQTMVFTCFVVAGGLTTDLDKGIIDRFRSLPISRASVLIGRSIASLLHSSIGVVVMCLTGLAIGWRIRTNPVDAILGFAVLLLFGGPAARVGDKLVRPRVARPGSWWTRMRWVSIVQGGVVGAGGGRSVRSR